MEGLLLKGMIIDPTSVQFDDRTPIQSVTCFGCNNQSIKRIRPRAKKGHIIQSKKGQDYLCTKTLFKNNSFAPSIKVVPGQNTLI